MHSMIISIYTHKMRR